MPATYWLESFPPFQAQETVVMLRKALGPASVAPTTMFCAIFEMEAIFSSLQPSTLQVDANDIKYLSKMCVILQQSNSGNEELHLIPCVSISSFEAFSEKLQSQES